MTSKPIWKGPRDGGISFSMLCKFLACRERFRILVVEGLQEIREFNHKIEFGNMWHRAEQARIEGQDYLFAIREYAKQLQSEYLNVDKEILKWMNVCLTAYEIYVKRTTRYGRPIPKRTYLFAERRFSSTYQLPSGRQVTLRGIIDSAFRERKKTYIQDNKTKGFIDTVTTKQSIQFDLQLMMYHLAYPCDGVCYTVIRRPLSDPRAIRQKKSETEKQFFARLGRQISKNPDEFFYEWRINVIASDVNKFRQRIFDPILESLCDWWEWVEADPTNPWRRDNQGIHFQFPFGVFHPILQGYRGDYFDYLTTGSKAGLEDVTW